MVPHVKFSGAGITVWGCFFKALDEISYIQWGIIMQEHVVMHCWVILSMTVSLCNKINQNTNGYERCVQELA